MLSHWGWYASTFAHVCFMEYEQILSLQLFVVFQSSTRYNKLLLLSIYFCIWAFQYIMHREALRLSSRKKNKWCTPIHQQWYNLRWLDGSLEKLLSVALISKSYCESCPFYTSKKPLSVSCMLLIFEPQCDLGSRN